MVKCCAIMYESAILINCGERVKHQIRIYYILQIRSCFLCFTIKLQGKTYKSCTTQYIKSTQLYVQYSVLENDSIQNGGWRKRREMWVATGKCLYVYMCALWAVSIPIQNFHESVSSCCKRLGNYAENTHINCPLYVYRYCVDCRLSWGVENRAHCGCVNLTFCISIYTYTRVVCVYFSYICVVVGDGKYIILAYMVIKQCLYSDNVIFIA